MSRSLIVISGPAGSGKTSLGVHLQEKYDIAFLHKDLIKESLFDTLGYESKEKSRQLGIAAYEVLYHVADQILATLDVLIIESNFVPELSRGRILDIVPESSILEIHCNCEKDVLVGRVRAREHDPDRHPGHADVDWDKQGVLDRYVAFGFSNSITLDTTDLENVSYDGVDARVESFLKD